MDRPAPSPPRWLSLLLTCLLLFQLFVAASDPPSAQKEPYDINRARKVHNARAVSSHAEREAQEPHDEGGPLRGAAVATLVPDLTQYVGDGGRGMRQKRAVEGELSSYGGQGSVIGGMGGSRDINDWEVEDIVLLATVDGTLYARNRHTGGHLWALHSEKPVVETIDHRAARNGAPQDDDLVWIVEPVQDGGLYYFSPAMNGLKNVGVSVKDLVDTYAPFRPPGSGRVFNGERKTVTYALDTTNGNVTNVYSTGGSAMVVDMNCKKGLDPLEDDHVHEHGGYRKKGKTILVGRTEYTVTIQSQETEELLWTIKYAEWGPNNSDKDLAKQHSTSLDNKYIISLFDGSFMGFEQGDKGDSSYGKEARATFVKSLPSPVVRVFDVVHSLEKDNNDEYIILPQPKPPIDHAQAEVQAHMTFVGTTPDMNGWFAMTGTNFPYSAANARTAKWYDLKGGWHSLPLHQNKNLLIGLHRTIGFIPHIQSSPPTRRTLGAGDENTTRQLPANKPAAPNPPYDSTPHQPALLSHSRVLNLGNYSPIDILVVVTILAFLAYITNNQRRLHQRMVESENRRSNTIHLPDGRLFQHQQPLVVPRMELDVDATGQPRLEGPVPSPIVPDSVVAKMREESQLRRRRAREAEEDSEGLPVRMPVDKPLPSPPVEEVPQVGEEVKVVAEDEVKVQVEEEKVVEKELPSVLEKELEVLEKDLPKTPEMPKEMPKINTNIPEEVRKAEPEDGSTTPTLVLDTKDLPPGKVRFGDLDFSVGRPKTDEAVTVDQAPPKKKKTHRGQRGGAKKRKNKEAAIERAQKELEDRVIEGVEQMVDDKLQNDKEITPDVKMERGDIVINNLHISTEKVLGHGSHGTMVLRGRFEGREVAVKRMLKEYFEVANHEVKLLQESDDHPNVIRYYCKQQEPTFLYIALELCNASLWDIYSPGYWNENRELVESIKPEVALMQITQGVRHLHSLKIVHRDIKPQNILVQVPKPRKSKSGTPIPQHPRFIISDFGLCKKLEADQSSFRTTAANPAGTVGFRAPELLLAGNSTGPIITTSSDSSSATSTSTTTPTTTPSTPRRATKAIDIFSLGCVFFFVLTSGSHPFGPDRVHRESNICRGHSDLSPLSTLGPLAPLATDLISRMIHLNPRLRPDASQVLAHPFFWPPSKRLSFLLDVSDHFEAEPRDPPSPHLLALESGAEDVLGGDWYARIDPILIENLGKYRKYNGTKILDLLRALRNKKHHYQDLPLLVQDHLGTLPAGFLAYWEGRFPALVLHCRRVVEECGLGVGGRFGGYFEEG